MKRSLNFVVVCAFLAGCMSCSGIEAVAKEPARPNILFIISDDQSFDTIRSLGNREVHTPNLDRLAEQGISFTHAYNMGSYMPAVCVASRSMLVTGRFLWQSRDVATPFQSNLLWPQRMRDAGYETYMTGKWHVPADPNKVFDHAVKVRGGMPGQTPAGYNRPQSPEDDAWKPWMKQYGGFWQGGTHWSEVVGDETIGFLRRAAESEKPFFIYAAFNAPHDPRQSPQEFVEMYPLDVISLPPNYLPEYPYAESMSSGRDLRDEQLAPFPRTEYAVKVHRQEYYAIISHMDEQVGRILDALDEAGLTESTHIIFTSDHGLAVGQHGLMGKQNMYDHSVRVPFIISGPGIEKGGRRSTPIYLQDVMPTALEWAGGSLEGVDFKSLLPVIEDGARPHYPEIFAAYLGVQRMIVKDGFKLIHYPAASKFRLFDLVKDPHEMQDLADDPACADRLLVLKASLAQLDGTMRKGSYAP